MTVECYDCQKKHIYDVTCVRCCARLVISARPSKQKQESMLAFISSIAGSPSREKVLAACAERRAA